TVEDRAAIADESVVIDQPMLDALRASGLVELCVPAAYGGRHERVDPLSVTVVREALMATSAHLDSLFAMQGIGSHALGAAGSEELRERWLPRVVSLEAIAARALPEPGVASDLHATTPRTRSNGE